MPYIDLAGLSRYASRQKERLERDYALLRDMQWTRSEKAGAVSLWPARGTQLKPSVDFLFSETPPASGDKSPTNPSTITGVSNVAVTHGAGNVIEYTDFSTYSSYLSGHVTDNGDGSLTVNISEAIGSSQFIYRKNGTYDANMGLASAGYSTFLPQGEYKIGALVEGGTISDGSIGIRLNTAATLGGANIELNRYSASSSTIGGYKLTMPSGGGWYTFLIFVNGSTVCSNYRIRPYLYVVGADIAGDVIQVNTDYTIALGNTYYGGTLDVATGVMTVTWVGKVLDGTETIEKTSGYTNVGRYTISNIFGANQIEVNSSTNQFCTHYLYSGSNSDSSRDAFYVARSSGTAIIFSAANESKDDFVAWLAQQYSNGTPVKIVCKVDTPYTVQLSPTEILSLTQFDKYTPRLNTVYTDAQAVQVGYVKSPIRDEYELQQAVIAQGGNV